MINLHPVTATPEEMQRVAAYLEGKPGMFTAVRHLHETAKQMSTKQQLEKERA